jgi:ribonuclease-3
MGVAGKVRAAHALEERLGHPFRRPDLLERALTHSSFANEAGGGILDNEALEFLGDAVLSFLTAEILFRRTPEGHEGAMSRAKAQVVSDATLARVGERVGVGDHLRLGVGEERSGGRAKASLLSAAMEALIGAVFLDGGTRAARALVRRLLREELDEAGRAAPGADAKTALQELLQGQGRPAPRYEVVEEVGPDHRKRFRVRAWLGRRPLGEGDGRTKKAAEQEAARRALERLASG